MAWGLYDAPSDLDYYAEPWAATDERTCSHCGEVFDMPREREYVIYVLCPDCDRDALARASVRQREGRS